MRHLLAVLVLCILLVTDANANQAVVQGQLFSNVTSYPIPGLTVFLVHPNLGKSVPVLTDENGVYTLYGIPIMPDPYFIEIYWGPTLIFRDFISVDRYRVSLLPIYI